MDDELSTVCALLHDVAEDTEYGISDLRKMGFPESVLEVLALLTHEESVPYMDYVEKISHNATAKKVKLADLRHNSDLSRFSPGEIDEWALKRNEKYRQAIKLLTEK